MLAYHSIIDFCGTSYLDCSIRLPKVSLSIRKFSNRKSALVCIVVVRECCSGLVGVSAVAASAAGSAASNAS